MSTIRLLVKPALFTVGICSSCFVGAAIAQYENKINFSISRRQSIFVQDWMASAQRNRSNFTDQIIALRKRMNAWKNQLTTGEKIAGGTIFANFLVLCSWKVKGLRPIMMRFFISQASRSKIFLSPMILSCFSHSMPLHFAFNMYALYSFSNFANSLLGPEQLIGLFISAGVVSSLTSMAFRLATRSTVPSLGASGAILGVIAYVCITRPQSELLLFFVPISAGNAIKALMVVDFIGLVARWRVIDHAAHLGGSLFGVWYGLYGEQLFYKHRRDIIEKWVKFKGKNE